jgi:hypothetical protein
VNRLSAQREFEALKLLEPLGLAIPRPVAWNRASVVMTLFDGKELNESTDVGDPQVLLDNILTQVSAILQGAGLIHCDLGEFNVLANPSGDIAIIDWPQYEHVTHPNAEGLLRRDLTNLCTFFERKYGLTFDVESFISDNLTLAQQRNPQPATASLAYGEVCLPPNATMGSGAIPPGYVNLYEIPDITTADLSDDEQVGDDDEIEALEGDELLQEHQISPTLLVESPKWDLDGLGLESGPDADFGGPLSSLEEGIDDEEFDIYEDESEVEETLVEGSEPLDTEGEAQLEDGCEGEEEPAEDPFDAWL